MATITLDELHAVRPSFNALSSDARPENSTGQCAHREYKFTEAVKHDIYQVKSFSDAEIISLFSKIQSREFVSLSEPDFYAFVCIALSVRHPVQRSTAMLALTYPANILCSDYASAAPTPSRVVPFTVVQQVGKTLSIVPGKNTAQDPQTLEESAAEQADAICFYFAWMTRFAVKTPSAALPIQMDKLRETYLKFYQKSSGIFDAFRPDAAWLGCLRNCFDSLPRVKNTMVLHVASAETNMKADPKAFNILRFLFFQNMEFMGMHAYVSIVSIMNKVALPPALILTWLRMSGVEGAVDEAYEIMSKHDNGMILNGLTAERLWKYARLLDPGYFNKLQTAYAAELMSTLAYIEIQLGLSSEGGYNSPLNIHAIADNAHIRNIGKMKAEAFMQCKNKIVSLSADASVVDKLYAMRAGSVIAPEAPSAEPMDVDATRAAKRKVPEPTAPEKVLEKKKPPQINLTNVPNI